MLVFSFKNKYKTSWQESAPTVCSGRRVQNMARVFPTSQVQPFENKGTVPRDCRTTCFHNVYPGRQPTG